MRPSKPNSVGEGSRSLGLKRASRGGQLEKGLRRALRESEAVKCQGRKHGRGHLHLQSHSLRPIEGLYGVSTSLPFSTSFEVWTVCVWSSFPLEIHQPPEHTSSSNRRFPPSPTPDPIVCSAVVQKSDECGWGRQRMMTRSVRCGGTGNAWIHSDCSPLFPGSTPENFGGEQAVASRPLRLAMRERFTL